MSNLQLKKLINTVRAIDVNQLPRIEGLIIEGKPVEQLSREQLIRAVYVFARRFAQIEMAGKTLL